MSCPSPKNQHIHSHRKWEDAPLAQELFVLNNLLLRVGERLVCDEGLTASRWLFLGALEQYDEPPSLTELSNDALLTVQNVSRMAASLEEDGLVERFTCPGKGRSVFIDLTDAGRDLCKRCDKHCKRFRDQFLKGLSPNQIKQAERLLHRLIDNLEQFEQEQKSDA